MSFSSVLLSPLAFVYGRIIAARNTYYDCVASASHDAGIPVISVGNLTVGGTGKTPMVIELARRLKASGRRPAILTRGYRARPGEEADEVRELHLALPGVPVVVDPDRVRGAAGGVQQHGADMLLLDDGFQHRRLRRNLDIVLIDALSPWGGGWVLPAGRLREPRTSLRRASCIIVTRANQSPEKVVSRLLAELRSLVPYALILTAAAEPAGPPVDAAGDPASRLNGVPMLAVAGLGNPATFFRTLADSGVRLVAQRTFSDHHRYGASDVAQLTRAAESAGAAAVVTTRKDWVKLQPLWQKRGTAAAAIPLLRLEMRVVICDPDGALDKLLQSVL